LVKILLEIHLVRKKCSIRIRGGYLDHKITINTTFYGHKSC